MGEFVMNNLALVALFLASGAMLLWPEFSRLAGASNEISTLEATRIMNGGPHLVLDVGDAPEFAAGHLPKARNIPVRELGARLEEIAKYKERPVIVACKGATRASSACRFLKRSGFSLVYQLKEIGRAHV